MGVLAQLLWKKQILTPKIYEIWTSKHSGTETATPKLERADYCGKSKNWRGPTVVEKANFDTKILRILDFKTWSPFIYVSKPWSPSF
jgi:hypothetical protein